MKIVSIGYLNIQIGKIKVAIQKKDKVKMENLYNEYSKELNIPSKEVYHNHLTTIASKNISYHLLSTYYLLDLIDSYWDGKDFVCKEEKEEEHPLLFQKELEYIEPASIDQIEAFKHVIDRISEVISTRLYIFLYPFKSKEEGQNYIGYNALLESALIIFGDEKNRVKQSIYEGVAQFYLKTILKEQLPSWAQNEISFKNEFIAWCENRQSQFK